MELPPISVGEMVRVRWLDAFNAPQTWTGNDEIELDCEYPVDSLGYYVGVGKSCLLICGDVGEGQKSRLFYIPIGMILGLERIGNGKEVKGW
jgi:hypothetical protein